jgi:acetyl esterase
MLAPYRGGVMAQQTDRPSAGQRGVVAPPVWPGRLDPEARALLDAFDAQGVQPFDRMSVLQARASVAASTRIQGPRPDVASVRDLLAPAGAGRLPVRVYHPEPGRLLPLLVYLHGGGFVTGSVAVADRACRALAVSAGCVVVSVEYRLAPESPFPGPLDDAVAAVRWAAAECAALGGDVGRLVVAGDSAGGALAAAAVRVLRDGGGPTVGRQLLVYPTLAPVRGRSTLSLDQNGEGYSLTRGALEWFWDHHLARPEDATDPLAAPLLAGDADLVGLPAATVVVAEFDPLRDDGLAYADRLAAAGVDVTVHRVPGTIHGFWWMAGALGQAGQLTAWLGEHLRAGWEQSA